MAFRALHLLLALLAFSQLMCLNGVPMTRLGSLMRRPQVHSGIIPIQHHVITEGRSLEEEAGRLAMELNDYPGSGANNRHTPKLQFARGCIDC